MPNMKFKVERGTSELLTLLITHDVSFRFRVAGAVLSGRSSKRTARLHLEEEIDYITLFFL